MRIRFANKRLRGLYVSASAPKGLDHDAHKAYCDKVRLIATAPNEQDLRNLKSLRYEKLKGTRSGQWSIRVNKQWRLILRPEQGHDSTTTIVIEELTKHYT